MANVFFEGPDGKYFRFDTPYGSLLHLLNFAIVAQGQLQTIHKRVTVSMFQ